jgi:hypothetical protein
MLYLWQHPIKSGLYRLGADVRRFRVFSAQGFLDRHLPRLAVTEDLGDGGLQLSQYLLLGTVSPMPVLDQTHQRPHQC